MIIYRQVIVKYGSTVSIHTQNMGYERFSSLSWYLVLCWIRIRIKVRPGSGSVTNLFTSWIRIQIRIKMIRIRNTADQYVRSSRFSQIKNQHTMAATVELLRLIYFKFSIIQIVYCSQAVHGAHYSGCVICSERDIN